MDKVAASFMLLVNLKFIFDGLSKSLSRLRSLILMSKFVYSLLEKSGYLPIHPDFLLLINFGFHCYGKKIIVELLPS